MINQMLANNSQISNRKQLILTGHTSWRYIRLLIDLMQGADSHIMISKIEFVRNDGQAFHYPDTTLVERYRWTDVKTSESAFMLLDYSTSTKWCAYRANGTSADTTGSYVLIDLGSNCLDTLIYSKWQWWTANDTSQYSARNMKSFKLLLSDDGNSWHLADECLSMQQVARNYALAYEGQLK